MSGCPSTRVSFRPPNGDELLFVGLQGGESVPLHHRRGRGLEPAPRGRADNGHPGTPQWSPDGSRIAYSSVRRGQRIGVVHPHRRRRRHAATRSSPNPPRRDLPARSRSGRPTGSPIVVARGYWDDPAIVPTRDGGGLSHGSRSSPSTARHRTRSCATASPATRPGGVGHRTAPRSSAVSSEDLSVIDIATGEETQLRRLARLRTGSESPPTRRRRPSPEPGLP